MTSVKGDGQQQEQGLSGSDVTAYFSLALAAVLQRRPLVFAVLLAGATPTVKEELLQSALLQTAIA